MLARPCLTVLARACSNLSRDEEGAGAGADDGGYTPGAHAGSGSGVRFPRPLLGGDMANVLKTEKKVAVISMLVEGQSIRSIERVTGVHRDTILRLMVRVA